MAATAPQPTSAGGQLPATPWGDGAFHLANAARSFERAAREGRSGTRRAAAARMAAFTRRLAARAAAIARADDTRR